MMSNTDDSLRGDISKLAAIPFLPALLEVVCAATGMGFAAVARVTESRWIAGVVKDDIGFGLKPGGELPIASTICHEIRQSKTPVIIDHVAHDAVYCKHHTPATYGFQSYISFPIMLKDGSFFGTLCAIDPKAAIVNTGPMIELFTTLASLIAAYLEGMEQLSERSISRLQMYTAAELRNFSADHEAEASASVKTELLLLKIRMLLMAIDTEAAMAA